MKSVAALILLGAFAALAFETAQAADCPKLKAAPIDEKWFLESRPAGFRAQLARGNDKSDLAYTPKPPSPEDAKPKPKKLCWRSHVSFKGQDMGPGPAMQCTYETLSEQCCQLAHPEIGKMATALLGVNTPSAVHSTIVLTDNKTYFVVGGCVDGVLPSWSVMSVDGKAALDNKAIADALGVPQADVDRAGKEQRPFMPGATKVSEGDCGPDELPTITPETMMAIKEYVKS